MTPEEKFEIRANLIWLFYHPDVWHLWLQSMTYVGVHYPHIKSFYMEGIWREHDIT